MATIDGILPDEPLFHHLISAYRAHADRILVEDPPNGIKADYTQFLTDVLHLRHMIREQLPEQMLNTRGLISVHKPYIFIIATRSYDFIVATYAALAIGAAMAPISNMLLPQEACHLLQAASACCLLVSPQHEPEGRGIIRHWRSNSRGPLAMAPIQVLSTPLVPTSHVSIGAGMKVDPASPGALFFTSGTTGPPKGVVQSRRLWYQEPIPATADQAWLNFRSPHWFGVAQRLVASVQAGIRIMSGERSIPALWERLRLGDITIFHAPPAIYAGMMKHFQRHIDCLPEDKRSQYINGLHRLREIIVSGGVSWPTVTRFWNQLLGRPLRNIYGCTEAGIITGVMNGVGATTDRCIGEPYVGVEIKLSDGSSGEILVKSRTVFIGYLGNEEATRAVFDDDGWYKSGDFAHKVGDQYVIDGRASHDFIRFCGLRVPIHELEAHIVTLPYISEAYVVSATFLYQRQIAILVKPLDAETAAEPARPTDTKITLRRIREDLQDSGSLQQFKLPTLFRLLPTDEAAPLTGTGKTDRKAIVRLYFDLPEEPPLPEGIEFYDYVGMKDEAPKRQMWDWGGMGIFK